MSFNTTTTDSAIFEWSSTLDFSNTLEFLQEDEMLFDNNTFETENQQQIVNEEFLPFQPQQHFDMLETAAPQQEVSSATASSSNDSSCKNTSSRREEQFNRDYLYGIIDHALQGTKSDIGLRWSMLDFNTESTVCSSSTSATLSNNSVSSSISNSPTPTVVDSFHNAISTTPSNQIVQQQPFDQSQYLFNISTNQSTMFADVTSPNNQSSPQTFKMNRTITKKIQKKKPKVTSNIQFITEEGSSYPLDLSSCTVIRKNTVRPMKSKALKRQNQLSSPRSSSFSEFNQSSSNNLMMNSSSPTNYKVRFSHNVFEEISFKNTNPSQKFFKFNGIQSTVGCMGEQ